MRTLSFFVTAMVFLGLFSAPAVGAEKKKGVLLSMVRPRPLEITEILGVENKKLFAIRQTYQCPHPDERYTCVAFFISGERIAVAVYDSKDAMRKKLVTIDKGNDIVVWVAERPFEFVRP